MKVNEFLEKYNGDVDRLVIKEYVPTREKVAAINAAIETSMDEDNKFMATYNSVAINITKTITGIDLYTDLEVEGLEDYDRLMETGVIDSVIGAMSKDYIRFNSYFDMRLKDYIREKNNIDGIVNRIGNVLNGLLKDIDSDTILKLLEMIGNE